jgi:hypothetical protein
MEDSVNLKFLNEFSLLFGPVHNQQKGLVGFL